MLFCDVVGSTALSMVHDPEDLGALLGDYRELVADAVRSRGGYVAQYLGDGIMAYFGYPTAAEDAPHQAVAAGMDILEAVGDLRVNDSASSAVSVRVGIHTGLVVTGGTGPTSGERLVLGATPNIAAHIQAACERNSVLIGESTADLVRNAFELKAMAVQQFKGSEKRMTLFAPVRQRWQIDRFAVRASAGLTPLVGRSRELDQLREITGDRTNTGSLFVGLEGEPGLGKSRLVHELLERADPNVLWLSSSCPRHHQHSAFYCAAEWVRALRSQSELTLSPAIEDELSELLGDRLAARNRSRHVASEHRRSRAIEAVVATLLQALSRGPLALIVDDAQWIDPSSIEVLEALRGHASTVGLTGVFVYRPGEVSERVRALLDRQLNLDPLSSADAMVLARHSAGAGELSAEVLRQVVQRSAGVPLFVEELSRGADTSDEGNLTPSEMPGSLESALLARLDGTGDLRRVASLCAVVGKFFSKSLVARLAGIDEEEAGRHLAGLQEMFLIVPSSSESHAFEFRHGLVQEAAYNNTLKRDRIRIHSQVAEILLEPGSEALATNPSVVGSHLDRAGRRIDAIGCYLNAGREAANAAAHREAIGLFEAALAVIPRLEETAEPTEAELEIQVQLASSRAAALGYAHPSVREAYSRALELCETANGDFRASHTRLLDSRMSCAKKFSDLSTSKRGESSGERLFWSLWGFGAYHQARGELAEALGIGLRLIDLAGADPALELEGNFGAGSTLFFMGRFREAEGQLARGEENSEVLGRSSEVSPTGHHADVLCLCYRALGLMALGHTDEAANKAALALQLSRSHGHHFSVAYVQVVSAWLAQMRGERDAAAAAASSAIATAEEHGFPFIVAWGVPVLAWAQSPTDHEAVSRLRGVLEGYVSRGFRVAITYFKSVHAEVLLDAKRPEEALVVIREALRVGAETGERFWEAALRGQLALAHHRARTQALIKPAALLSSAFALAREQKAELHMGFLKRVAAELDMSDQDRNERYAPGAAVPTLDRDDVVFQDV